MKKFIKAVVAFAIMIGSAQAQSLPGPGLPVWYVTIGRITAISRPPIAAHCEAIISNDDASGVLVFSATVNGAEAINIKKFGPYTERQQAVDALTQAGWTASSGSTSSPRWSAKSGCGEGGETPAPVQLLPPLGPASPGDAVRNGGVIAPTTNNNQPRPSVALAPPEPAPKVQPKPNEKWYVVMGTASLQDKNAQGGNWCGYADGKCKYSPPASATLEGCFALPLTVAANADPGQEWRQTDKQGNIYIGTIGKLYGPYEDKAAVVAVLKAAHWHPTEYDFWRSPGECDK